MSDVLGDVELALGVGVELGLGGGAEDDELVCGGRLDGLGLLLLVVEGGPVVLEVLEGELEEVVELLDGQPGDDPLELA